MTHSPTPAENAFKDSWKEATAKLQLALGSWGSLRPHSVLPGWILECATSPDEWPRTSVRKFLQFHPQTHPAIVCLESLPIEVPLSQYFSPSNVKSVSCSVVSNSDSLPSYEPCSPPASSVHGILQARILEWVAVPFSRGSSQPRDRTWVSRIAADSLYLLRQQGNP